MKIAVIGWYGTETIGDRAILAGIVKALSKAYGEFSLAIGSLYPFFSERMLDEDYNHYQDCSHKNINVTLFNSKKEKELNTVIKNSDVVLIGGGPLMHISPIFMLEYAFKLAQKHNKKTIVAGCGIGPFFKKKFNGSLNNILKNANAVVLRDTYSGNYLKKIFSDSNFKKWPEIKFGIDPSVISIKHFLNTNTKTEVPEKTIAFNLRSFPSLYSEKGVTNNLHQNLLKFTNLLCEQFDGYNINLTPMNYFHAGDDDRVYLNKIWFELNQPKNLSVQNEPLSLLETYEQFYNATFCLGMRFHSVVFQTFLNGNNFVLDYTEPKIGKISGLIADNDEIGFYKNRYTNLQSTSTINLDFSTLPKISFKPNWNEVDKKVDVLIEAFKSLNP